MTTTEERDGRPAPARNNSSSLRRALGILSFLAGMDSHPRGVTLAELTTGLDMSKSTVLRLLAPLCDVALVERDVETGRYRLGPQTAYLGQIYLERLDLPNVCRDVLHRLTDECGETTHLVVPEGTDVFYVDKVEARQPVRMYSRIGTRQPAYCTGVGKALLAHAEPDLVHAVVAAGMPVRTPRTITTEPAMLTELAAIRERGYSIDNGENEGQIRCVAAPIFDHTRSVAAAISISGPGTRVTEERIPELGALIVRAAAELSGRLGAPLTPEG